MEQIINIAERMQGLVNEEIRLIEEDERSKEFASQLDNIKIAVDNFSSEIRYLRPVVFESVCKENAFFTYQNKVVVFLAGFEVLPGRATAKGCFMVQWNKDHPLNTVRSNCLGNKAKGSSLELGMLVILTQCKVMNRKNITVVCDDEHPEKLWSMLDENYVSNVNVNQDLKMRIVNYKLEGFKMEFVSPNNKKLKKAMKQITIELKSKFKL